MVQKEETHKNYFFFFFEILIYTITITLAVYGLFQITNYYTYCEIKNHNQYLLFENSSNEYGMWLEDITKEMKYERTIMGKKYDFKEWSERNSQTEMTCYLKILK